MIARGLMRLQTEARYDEAYHARLAGADGRIWCGPGDGRPYRATRRSVRRSTYKLTSVKEVDRGPGATSGLYLFLSFDGATINCT
jgi:hypothetical protein